MQSRTPVKGRSAKKLRCPTPATGRSAKKEDRSSHRSQLSRPSANAPRSQTQQRDPRPINEKAAQQRWAAEILTYLNSRGFSEGRHVSSGLSKLDSRLPKKTAVSIIQFLAERLEHQVDTTDEGICNFMKLLRYPYMFSKSFLSAVTPGTWPIILGGIYWLLRLVVAFECERTKLEFIAEDEDRPSYVIMDDDDEANDDVVYHNYIMMTYKRFMEGDDECDDLDELLAERLEGDDCQVKAELAQLESREKLLREEVGALKQARNSDEEVLGVEESVGAQITMLEHQRTSQQQQVARLATEASADEADASRLQAEIEALEAEVGAAEQQVAAQPYTAADVRRAKAEKRAEEQRVRDLAQEVERAEAATDTNKRNAEGFARALSRRVESLKQHRVDCFQKLQVQPNATTDREALGGVADVDLVLRELVADAEAAQVPLGADQARKREKLDQLTQDEREIDGEVARSQAMITQRKRLLDTAASDANRSFNATLQEIQQMEKENRGVDAALRDNVKELKSRAATLEKTVSAAKKAAEEATVAKEAAVKAEVDACLREKQLVVGRLQSLGESTTCR